METPSPSPKKPVPQAGTFAQLRLVLAVAFLLATLYTAWTPSMLAPGHSVNPDFLNFGLAPTTTPGGPTATPRANPLVGIVVGHWGDNHDPGAVCADDNLTELEVNQNIATRVKSFLESQGVDVVLLKEFDPRLNGFQASALVSIHADSCDYINDQATGFKVAAALANPHPERAARLTACLRQRYAQATNLPLHSTSITEDMTSYHAFGEIQEDTTAVIIETGFLNLDRKLLTDSPDLPAGGIAAGVICFLHNEDISGPAPTVIN